MNWLIKSFLFYFMVLNITALPQTDRPVVMLHGLDGDAENMIDLKNWFETNLSKTVYNIELGDGKKYSVYTPIEEQLKLLDETISNISDLRYGFDFVGMSQGGLLARAYVQLYSTFPVYNLISLVSPQGGVYIRDVGFINYYSNHMQNGLSFTNYWRDPIKYIEYLASRNTLSKLNCESECDVMMKQRLLKLENFIMVYSPNDDVLSPPESGKFSMFKAFDKDQTVQDVSETKIYQRLGLDILNSQGKLVMGKTNCTHNEHKMPICFDQLYQILHNYI